MLHAKFTHNATHNIILVQEKKLIPYNLKFVCFDVFSNFEVTYFITSIPCNDAKIVVSFRQRNSLSERNIIVKLSVIIPCYNEVGHITKVLDAVKAVDIPKEIIVVDDGSTDHTAEVVEDYNQDGAINLHLSPHNFGKGAAIRTGLRYVTGDIVIIQDADLEYDPQQYPQIIKPIIDGNAEVVYGSRFAGTIEKMRLPNRIANYILTLSANLLFKAKITDEATCYKAFKADIIKSIPLKCTRFEFCPEVTAKIRKRGIKIAEVPIHYISRNAAQGKKIRWTDAFSAIWTLIKYRFVD